VTVSNEDREAAVRLVAEALQGAAYGKASIAKAGRVLAALVSHGWGPRPTVSTTELASTCTRMFTAYDQDSFMKAYGELDAYLRERGIVVAE
jgi:O-acetyl-ADP-ribose deacetylase (regulator of RNase III)